MKNHNRGFIALISVIVIAAILLVIMTEGGLASFFARFDSLGEENREQARSLAESCIQIALLNIARSSGYSVTDQTIDIGTDENGDEESCVIQNITRDRESAVINAYASYGDSYANVSSHTIVNN